MPVQPPRTAHAHRSTAQHSRADGCALRVQVLDALPVTDSDRAEAARLATAALIGSKGRRHSATSRPKGAGEARRGTARAASADSSSPKSSKLPLAGGSPQALGSKYPPFPPFLSSPPLPLLPLRNPPPPAAQGDRANRGRRRVDRRDAQPRRLERRVRPPVHVLRAHALAHAHRNGRDPAAPRRRAHVRFDRQGAWPPPPPPLKAACSTAPIGTSRARGIDRSRAAAATRSRRGPDVLSAARAWLPSSLRGDGG